MGLSGMTFYVIATKFIHVTTFVGLSRAKFIRLDLNLVRSRINFARFDLSEVPEGQCHLVKGKNKATIELTGEHLFFVATKYKTQWLKQI